MWILVLCFVWFSAEDFPPPENQIILVQVKDRIGFGIVSSPEMQRSLCENFEEHCHGPLTVNFPFQYSKNYDLIHLENWAQIGLPSVVLHSD